MYNMTSNKSRCRTLIAIVVVMASLVVAATTTMIQTPIILKATTDEEENDDRDDSRALTLTMDRTNPSGHDVKEIKSDDHSERSATKETLLVTSKVKEAASTDEPALTLKKVSIDEDGTMTEETKLSSEESSKSASKFNAVKTEVQNAVPGGGCGC